MVSIQKDPLLQVEATCRPLLCELQWVNLKLTGTRYYLSLSVGAWKYTGEKLIRQTTAERKLGRLFLIPRESLRLSVMQWESGHHILAFYFTFDWQLFNWSKILQAEQKPGRLKEELSTLIPYLEDMRKRKVERKNQFLDVIEQIQEISTEIYGSESYDSKDVVVDENDLSLKRLEELQRQLQSLEKEKSVRRKQVTECLSVLSSFCSVLGLDFKDTVREIHPSLVGSDQKRITDNHTLEGLEAAIKRLRELKLQRMQRLQDLATMLLELWDLMDTPVNEQQAFRNVTCNIAASEDEMTEPNMLSGDFIKYVEVEVSRLEKLKSSKLIELVLKKRSELEELCQKMHLVCEADGGIEDVLAAVESGALDPTSVLEQIELEVGKVKEEAFSRKEILERVEKWLSACEEEEWLEDFNMDENRYSAGHLTLKRAEKARVLVSKIPGMVEALTAKVQNWEDERGVEFMYDGNRLLSMLDEYTTSRQEKEQEKKRQREQKKLQVQLGTAQDSKHSPVKSKQKHSRLLAGSRGAGGNLPTTPRSDSMQSARAMTNSRTARKDDRTGASPVRRMASMSRNYTFNGRESEPNLLRRPSSPMSSLPRANADQFDDHNTTHSNTKQKPLHADASGEDTTGEERECSFEEMRADATWSGRHAKTSTS